MPDRTQQTLDDLADLFLTGTRTATPPRATLPKPTVSDRGPAPQPAPQTTPNPNPNPKPTASDRGAAPRLEAVLLGNLPGMAHVWLTQYAQHVAEREGPVLLLTVNPDHDDHPRGALEAELIEPRVGDVLERLDPAQASPPPDPTHDDWFAPFPQRGSARPNPRAATREGDDVAALLGFSARHAAATLPDNRPPSPPLDLATLLQDPRRPIAAVLVYTDTDPREIDRLLDVEGWTLLTGADPTALAAAEQGLRALATADPQARDARVGLFVVGCPEPKAHAAADHLAHACADLFHEPPRFHGHLPKIRPAAVRTLGTLPELDARWTELLNTLDNLPAPTTNPTPTPTPKPTVSDRGPAPQPAPKTTPTPVPVTVPAPTTPRSLLASFLDQAKRRPATVTPKTQSLPPKPTVSDRGPAPQLPPQPALKTTPKTAATPSAPPVAASSPPDHPDRSGLPNLPALLADASPQLDLQPLPVRCPEHPHLDLAADARGRLHLLARLDDADHPRPTLLALTDARRWATQHQALLALAMPQAAPPPWPTPVLHLFTDRPDRAVPLVAALDPTVQLHLLQNLPLDTGPTWLVTALQTSN